MLWRGAVGVAPVLKSFFSGLSSFAGKINFVFGLLSVVGEIIFGLSSIAGEIVFVLAFLGGLSLISGEIASLFCSFGSEGEM